MSHPSPALVPSDAGYLSPDERQLLLRFWRCASGFWRGRSASWAWTLTIMLVATVVLQLLTQYFLNYWNRDFFTVTDVYNRVDGSSEKFSYKACIDG